MDHTDGLIHELTEFQRLRNIFNPFKVLDNAGREETHSRMLAWLLDPHGSHGMGEFFASKFLPLPNGRNADFGELIVEREVQIRDGRLDLLVTNPREKFVWAIELKTYSGERENQLSNYREWCEQHKRDREGYIPDYLYVTRYGETPKDDQWKAIGYECIVRILSERPALRSACDEGADRFIADYVDALQRWFLLGSMSQNQGRIVLEAIGGDLSGFPPELRKQFEDEYRSLERLLLRIQEDGARALAAAA
jgi:hypothetical protein